MRSMPPTVADLGGGLDEGASCFGSEQAPASCDDQKKFIAHFNDDVRYLTSHSLNNVIMSISAPTQAKMKKKRKHLKKIK